MKSKESPLGLLLPVLVFMLVLASFLIWPQMDIAVYGWFYLRPWGFVWQNFWPLKMLNDLAYYGPRAMGALFLLCAIPAYAQRKSIFGLPGRSWVFLFMALAIGPGLIANGILKDHWGRARPREVVQFGGRAFFTPPLIVAQQCATNCSFVAGDAAFGFFLPTFAYVVRQRRSRRVFWGLTGLGSIFGVARIMMGAHFLSDVLFAAFFMYLISALLYGVLYGWDKLEACWRRFYQGESRPIW
jgi:lipid A 4'-phosphatase